MIALSEGRDIMRKIFLYMTMTLDASELTRTHLEELLSSKTFQHATKLSRLLRRLVESTLTGAADPIRF